MDWLRQFDPDPQWYLWTLHSITAVSLPIYLIGIICILRVNIVTNSSVYKYFLATNLTLSYLTQLSLSAGTIPILVLPTPGGYPLGLLSRLGVSSCFQFGAVVSLVTANGLTTVMLFLYRSHVAIPFSRTVFYGLTWLFILGAVCIPPVLLGILCKTMDIDMTRDKYQKDCPVIFDLLSSRVNSDTLLILEITPFLVVIRNYFELLGCLAIILVTAFTYRATVLVRKKIFSDTAVHMHKTLVRTLIIQTTVYYSFFIIPAGFILAAVSFAFALPNAGNLTFVFLSLSDPASVLALILSHRKYRRAVLRPFSKEKEAIRPVNYDRSPRRSISQLQDPHAQPSSRPPTPALNGRRGGENRLSSRTLVLLYNGFNK